MQNLNAKSKYKMSLFFVRMSQSKTQSATLFLSQFIISIIMQHNSPVTSAARKKIPARFSTIVFSFYMAALMACFMCFVIVGANTGLHDGYLSRVWHTYQFAMPVAFICVLIVRPIALRLLSLTVEKN